MTLRARILLVLGVACAVAAAALSVAAGGGELPRYRIELDNTFGLTEGSQIRVAGVEAGTLRTIRLDRRTLRPVVEVEMTAAGFGDLRRDAFCQARPQSLIGEYFLDCDPGRGERLPANGVIPVRQTASVVPPDLIQNVMRRPYRERFSIILSELGMALAGRGEDLNEAIRRASPALREVNRVLEVLARQRRTIRDLYQQADAVLAEVAARRRDVGRFVEGARDTAGVYAEQADEVDRQLQLLPEFLDELRPTLAALEGTAEAQRPALAALRASAPALSATLRTSAAFSRASLPSIRSLARVARRGERAARIARPNLARLAEAVRPLPETAGNLGIVLDHMDDRDFAHEPDARAPDPRGFTGLENLARFGYGVSQATNWFDKDSHLLKVVQYADDVCGPYATAERARELPDRCHAWLGPNQPGINQPDPTAGATRAQRRRPERGGRRERRRSRRVQPPAATPAPEAAPAPSATPAPEPTAGPPAQLLDRLLDDAQELLGGRPTDLLDYLLGP